MENRFTLNWSRSEAISVRTLPMFFKNSMFLKNSQYSQQWKIKTRFIQWTKFSMFCHINEWPRQLSSGLMPFSYQGLCRPIHPRAASGLMPISYQGLCRPIYPRAASTQTSRSARGLWAPKVRSFQDVHRPRGSLSNKNQQINVTYTFSLSCLENKIFWNMGAQPFNLQVGFTA